MVSVDIIDDFSSKSLDVSLDSSKNIVDELEPKNSNEACDSNEMLGTIKARDLEIKLLGQRITTLKEKNVLLETEMSNLKRRVLLSVHMLVFHLDVRKITCLVIELRFYNLKIRILTKSLRISLSSQQSLNKLVGVLEIILLGKV